MKRILLLFLFVTSYALSQTETRGYVFDEYNDPMPYANVLFQNSIIGTITDENGFFELSDEQTWSVLEISFVGYETTTINLKKVNNANIKIILKEEAASLEEVLIVTKPKKRLKKKENPAYRIMKSIWANKKSNGLKLSKAYQYKKYKSTEIGLNNLNEDFLKRVFKESYDSIISIVEKDKRKKNFNIPLFLKEFVTAEYGNNETGSYVSVPEAEKNTGINQDGFIFERAANIFNEIDVYKNNIEILNRTFVSPLSTDGFASYDYVLQDSIQKNNKTYYSIYFFPRNDADLVFEGNFNVESKTFAIANINMKTNKKINLNLVRNLYFEKWYELKNDSVFLPKRNVYEADLTVLTKNEKEKGMYVKRFESFDNYVFNQPKEVEFYDQDTKQFKANQYVQEASFWKQNTPVNDQMDNTEIMLERLSKNRKIKNISGLITTVSSGYVNLFEGIQLGPLWTTFANNDVEGFKVNVGARTFKTLDDRFRSNILFTYGFKDEKFKYRFDSKYLLFSKPRLTLGFAISDDTEQLGSRLLTNLDIYGNRFGTTALFVRGENFFISRVRKRVVNVNLEPAKNLQTGVILSNRRITTAAPKDKFNIDFFNKEINGVDDTLIDNSVGLYAIYTPRRNIYGFGVERKLGANLFPTFLVSFQKGLAIDGGDTNYSKLQFLYNQPLKLSKLGVLDATLEFGKIYGDAQLPILAPIPANQSLSLVRNTFSLINYYDFITDAYLTGHFEHHFNGFVLNRIPLLNKLKLRGLLTFRGAYGKISDSNIELNRSDIVYNNPEKVYYEYGFGIENIGYGNLRIFRLDFIWRSDYSSPNNLNSPEFGIRLGIKPEF